MRTSFFYVLLLFAGFNVILGQIPQEVVVVLNQLDKNRLEKAALEFDEARSKMEAALSYYESIPRDSTSNIEIRMDMETEALRKLDNASELFLAASEAVYTIYNRGCQEFWKDQEKQDHYATGLEKAKYMQREAKRMMRESRLLRQQVFWRFMRDCCISPDSFKQMKKPKAKSFCATFLGVGQRDNEN